jgi:hypothetical protein
MLPPMTVLPAASSKPAPLSEDAKLAAIWAFCCFWAIIAAFVIALQVSFSSALETRRQCAALSCPAGGIAKLVLAECICVTPRSSSPSP